MSDKLQAPGWFEGATHYVPQHIYYEHTDFTGVVYHANYLKFFEKGRSDQMRTIGVDHKELLTRDPPMGFVVLKIELDFIKPARVDDDVLIRTRYLGVKGPRSFYDQCVLRDDEELCKAHVTACAIYLDGRPARPDKILRERFKPYIYTP